MSQLCIGFDAEALVHLEAARDALIVEDANYVARCAIGLMLYCIPRVHLENYRMGLIDRESSRVICKLDIEPDEQSPKTDAFSGLVTDDENAPLAFKFEDDVSRRIRECARFSSLSPHDFVRESCRL